MIGVLVTFSPTEQFDPAIVTKLAGVKPTIEFLDVVGVVDNTST